MTLCAVTFANTSFIEEALKYLLRIAAKLAQFYGSDDPTNSVTALKDDC